MILAKEDQVKAVGCLGGLLYLGSLPCSLETCLVPLLLNNCLLFLHLQNNPRLHPHQQLQHIIHHLLFYKFFAAHLHLGVRDHQLVVALSG